MTPNPSARILLRQLKTPLIIPVTQFAVPVPRRGSIEPLSGYGRATEEGREIHARVQARRLKAESNYEAEKVMSHTFERDGYQFKVGGRMDGFFAPKIPGGPPKIEEIKSCFRLDELGRKLKNQHHPYNLQLRTYGYMYWLQNQVTPSLSFHLVSSRNFVSEDLDIQLDALDYQAWLERRLDELVEEAKLAEKRAARRRKAAKSMEFPFPKPRTGQFELIGNIERGMGEKKRLWLQAPTGLGKTVGVLYPSLKEALARGQKVVYVTPKNSQHLVAEEAVDRFAEQGTKLKSLTVTAKSKICFKNEPLCNPDYCEFAKDHYSKVADNGIPEQLAKKRKLTMEAFREIGEQFQVCPFELQQDAAKEADVVICDYNYVFSPRSALGNLGAEALSAEGKPNLVIDEAHNLYSRAIGYYSPELSTLSLERMRPEIKELPSQFRDEAESLLNSCQKAIELCRPEKLKPGEKGALIDPPAQTFLEQDDELRAFLSRYLESDVEIQPRDVVLRLIFYWSEFTSKLDFITTPPNPVFFTTFQTIEWTGLTKPACLVKITCCDASEMLKECYDEFDNVVGFSATLKPFDYYAKLSGLDPKAIETAEFKSPFPKSQRKVLIIPEISTKYSQRQSNYQKIAEAIERIAELRPGNYFAFFPSFQFLEEVLKRFRTPKEFVTLRQYKEMKLIEISQIVEHLEKRIAPTVVFAVQGGVFSEGMDYPGETVIGAFVVGPPLPTFDLEREKMREYYQRTYGAGFDYAYSYPAMAKAVQAAGRVILSETDRGIIVLMDSRFLETTYSNTMPGDWFENSPRELVSRSILKDVRQFWNDVEPGQVT